jgi:hypothetical protein
VHTNAPLADRAARRNFHRRLTGGRRRSCLGCLRWLAVNDCRAPPTGDSAAREPVNQCALAAAQRGAWCGSDGVVVIQRDGQQGVAKPVSTSLETAELNSIAASLAMSESF